MSIIDRFRRKSPSSHNLARRKVEKAVESKEHELDFEYDETSDILDATLDSVKRRSDEAQEQARKTIETLKSITFRPPAPGPSEHVG